MRYRLHENRYTGPEQFISRCTDPETITVQPDGLEKDEHNEVYAHEGSFIDKDGKVITLTKGEGLEFSADPIGILTEAVNVTDGPQGGSIMRQGTIYADRLPYPEGVEYEESFMATIEAKLPKITCIGCREPAKADSGAAAATTVDLSKATGTLGIDKGGTGATSASEALKALLESQPLSVENGGTGAASKDAALEALGGQKKLSDPLPIANGGTGAASASEALGALLESQPLSVENGGTGKGTASEALDALLESQPLPITKGGTGASDKDTAVTNLGAQKAE